MPNFAIYLTGNPADFIESSWFRLYILNCTTTEYTIFHIRSFFASNRNS